LAIYKSRNLILTVLKVGKYKIKTSAGSVSGKGRIFIDGSICCQTAEEQKSLHYFLPELYEALINPEGQILHDFITSQKAQILKTTTMEIKF
jgi:hypothetical protein